MSRTVYANRTQAELDAEDAKRQARRDAAQQRAALFVTAGSLMPTMAEIRAKRGLLSERDALKRARQAARLELRGSTYSADDRADVAAEILRRLLLDTGGAMPPADSPTVTLTAFCGTAANLRESISRRYARDRADEQRAAQETAQTSDALDIGAARAAAELALVSERGAVAAVAAVLAKLGVTAEPDEPVWLTLYQWVTGETSARVAERRQLGHPLARKRISAGARFLREFYSVEELGRLVAEGARAGSPILLVTRDDSRTAHGRTPAMAPDPREGTASHADAITGKPVDVRPERATSAKRAAELCKIAKLPREQRVHWTKQRARRQDRAEQTADAIAKLGRAAGSSGRKERAVSARSTLGRAALDG